MRHNMKSRLLFFTFLLSVFIISCKIPEEETETSWKKTSTESSQTTTDTDTQVGNITREYWGSWIRMDTGDEYYIDSAKIYKSSSSNKKYSVLSTEIGGYTLESNNILKNGSIVYFRKGGNARSFSIKASGFSDVYSTSNRAISTGKQNVSGRREDQDNSADSQTSISASDGTISFTDAVAGDTQTVTVDDGISKGRIAVTPKYNGENMGTVPLIESGTYGFKVTYSIDGDSQGFCFGNYYKTYTLSLNLNNIGSEICETSVYEVSYSDSNLQIIDGNLTGNFSSIEAGKAKTLSFSIRYGKLETEYIDVPISISITDSKYERTWIDSVTLRFYKGLVSLKINSRNFDASSNATLNGFAIYPDGRSNRFTVSAGNIATILLPWSVNNYTLVFSGATASNEMAYSFGFAKTTKLADLSGTWSISDINAYESNNSVNTAYTVSNLSEPIKAYLKNGDIDFYTVNCKNIEVKFEPVSVVGYAVKEYENGNADDLVTPGESHYLDVKVNNSTDSEIAGVSLKLSTTSSYVTLVRDSYTIGDMHAKYYYSLTDSASSSSYCYLMNSSYSGNAFKFSVSSDCPNGTELPFTVTFTDSSGNTWTDSFNITVHTTQAVISLANDNYANCSVKEYENGNNDGLVTPGESHYLDIKAYNSGASTALGVSVKLSTTSSYVTLVRDSYEIGDMDAKYYYSLTDSSSDSSYCSLMYSSYSNKAFKFSVSSDCPDGTELPFIVTFTDSSGNTWTDSFKISVQ